MRSATREERLVSWSIDAVIISLLMYILISLLGFIFIGDVDMREFVGTGDFKWYYEFVMVTWVWVVTTFYQYVSHKSKRKATFGQSFVGIKLVDGGGEHKGQVFFRDMANFWFWIVTVGLWLSKETGQTNYDDIFNLKVVKEEDNKES